jgi:hypothetical protein
MNNPIIMFVTFATNILGIIFTAAAVHWIAIKIEIKDREIVVVDLLLILGLFFLAIEF